MDSISGDSLNVDITYPTDIYLFKSQELKHHNNVWNWRPYAVFIVNLSQISHIVLVLLLLTLYKWIPAGLMAGMPYKVLRKTLKV